MVKKLDAYKFFNTSAQIEHYKDIYNKKPNFKIDYPANKKRLEIVINKIKKIKPKSILDAGCGNALPLIKIKKLGFEIEGFDKSENMVLEAKKNLCKNNFKESLVFNGDFNKRSSEKKYECIIGLGSFYYGKDLNTVLKNQSKMLKKNGNIIFSCRNELFNVLSFNRYTTNFLSRFYNIKRFNLNIKKKFYTFFKGYNVNYKSFLKNIDESKVKSQMHNPLTIENLYLKKNKLKLEEIDYYHFHCLPPSMEKEMGINYRKKSWTIEKPQDWRGIFLASGFVVTCKKIN